LLQYINLRLKVLNCSVLNRVLSYQIGNLFASCFLLDQFMSLDLFILAFEFGVLLGDLIEFSFFLINDDISLSDN